jgi:hypothetical protein
MKKRNVAGALGALMTGLVWVTVALVEALSPLVVGIMLSACLLGLILGLVAVRGRKWWLLQCLFALLTAAFVLFGLVGS